MKTPQKLYSILLVDDAEIVSQRIASLIKEHCDNYSISVAKGYDEAYHHLNNNEFDYVISEIHLEGKKRFDLIKFIKKRPKAPRLIVLSNQVSEQYKKNCLALGADFFVDKSIDFEKIPFLLANDDVGVY